MGYHLCKICIFENLFNTVKGKYKTLIDLLYGSLLNSMKASEKQTTIVNSFALKQ